MMILLHATELSCYIYISRFLYRSDENFRIKRLLPEAEIQRRHRWNAMTMMNQFVIFLIELSGIVLMVIMMIVVKSFKLQSSHYLVVIYNVTSPVLSVATVLACEGMRAKLSGIFKLNHRPKTKKQLAVDHHEWIELV